MHSSLDRWGQSSIERRGELVGEALPGRGAQQIDVCDQDVLLADCLHDRGDERGLAVAAWRDDQDALPTAQITHELARLGFPIGEVLASGHVAESEGIAARVIRAA
jgi:hypothetical protein